MAASEATLNKIHEFFAQYLLDLLTQNEDILNEEGEKVGERKLRVSAAELGVITKFLKDNNISFVSDDEDDADLQAIRNRAKQAALESGFSKQDIEDAKVGLDFRTH